MTRFYWLLLTIVAAPSALGQNIDYANYYKQLEVKAVQIEGPIVVDGKLDEAEWQLAEPAENFIQKIPSTGQPASEPTEVRILYDDDNLYLGVYCFDSAGADGIIINDITRDFYTLDSDGFQVIFDTYDDDRNSFLFGTNPGAAKFDMQIGADGAAGNTSWDGIWYVETHIDERGWQIEMAIPFKTLRFSRAPKQIWGVNFERRVRRKFEDSYWAPLPPNYRLGKISLGGTLSGLSGLQQGRNLYVKPYVSAPILRREADDVDFMPDAGVDVKYGVTSQLTFDATINTDFSQVEADEEQINLTRFSLFFPEKREFFLENAGIFEWGRRPREQNSPDLIPFFSRRIGIVEDRSGNGRLVPVHGGARLTGRAGKYTLGLLSMQTGEFEDTPSTNFSVLRVRRDFLRQSDVGGLFINKYQNGSDSNRTYGVDSNFNFFNYLDLTAYIVRTETENLSGEDTASDFEISWKDDFFDLYGGHLRIGENFNPEVGFVPRGGINKSVVDVGITPRPEESIPWLREVKPSVKIDYITGQETSLLETRAIEAELEFTFSDSSVLSFERESNFERLDEPFEIRSGQFIGVGDYYFDEFAVSYITDKSRMVHTEVGLRSGEFFDGNRDSYTLGVNFQPSYRFQAGVLWNHNDVELPSGDFRTNLVTTRLNYSFATNMFLNALIQYNSSEEEIISNIRFNFIHKPLSDFFLVYNERRSQTGDVIERALIAKLTYLFSF